MANKEFEVEHPEHHQMKIIDTTGNISLPVSTSGFHFRLPLSETRMCFKVDTASKLCFQVHYYFLVDVDFSETIRQMSEIRQDILIPRRPLWDETTTKEQLDRAEKDTFLIWRRELADKEENSKAVFTPFEKNIEFWRQLWRVIERSDLVVQLVDARRPLLFRCSDLEK